VSECLGVVIAGGLSSRMGTDKAQLERDGQVMLRYTTQLLEQLGLDVVLSGQGGIQDLVVEAGPVGGIYSVLQQQPAKALLVVPVDMPLLTKDALAVLLDSGEESGAAVCYEDAYLPLYLPVNEQLKDYLATLFETGELPENKRALSIKTMLTEIESLQVAFQQQGELLINTNTPEEWQAAMAKLTEVSNAE